MVGDGAPADTVQGLNVSYYDNADLTGPSHKRIDGNINFDWRQGSPEGVPGDKFSACWTGTIVAPSSGVYILYTSADDGVRLWVGGHLLIDKWEGEPGAEHVVAIQFKANASYDIRMEYCELGDNAQATLQWSTNELAKQVVPASALRPTTPLPVPTPARALPQLPRAGRSLRAHVNVRQHAAIYFSAHPGRLNNDPIVTDLSVTLRSPSGATLSIAEARREFQKARLALMQASPSTLIGTYISSRLARRPDQMVSWPPEAMPTALFSESEYHPIAQGNDTGRIVDYSQPATRAKMINYIVQEAVSRGQNVMFTDNWSHDQGWGGFIPWSTTVAYMNELRTALHAKGIRMIANVAIMLGSVPTADVRTLSQSTDGIALEMILEPYVTSNPTRMQRAFEQYQILLDAGTRIVFVPPPVEDEAVYETGARYLAALAMALDGPMVHAPFWKNNPDWQLWPETLGNPVGPATLSGTVISRTFEHGTIQVDVDARTFTMTL